jgi:hypothetical protein
MKQWQEILDYVVSKVQDKSTNLTALSKTAGVSIWWLQRMRSRRVVDPGFSKVGRVFQAFGGHSPKLPKEK